MDWHRMIQFLPLNFFIFPFICTIYERKQKQKRNSLYWKQNNIHKHAKMWDISLIFHEKVRIFVCQFTKSIS